MGINFKGVIKGTIFAILVTFVIILILALLSYFTGIDETIITTGVYASVIIGVILRNDCGIKSGKQQSICSRNACMCAVFDRTYRNIVDCKQWNNV